jgi:hypothetical protein
MIAPTVLSAETFSDLMNIKNMKTSSLRQIPTGELNQTVERISQYLQNNPDSLTDRETVYTLDGIIHKFSKMKVDTEPLIRIIEKARPDPLLKKQHEDLRKTILSDKPEVKNAVLKNFLAFFIDNPCPESEEYRILKFYGKYLTELDFEDLEFPNHEKRFVTDAVLQEIIKLTPNLEILAVNCSKLTDHGAQKIAKLRGLTDLRLSGCKHLSEDTIIKIIDHCPKLSHLEMIGYSNFSTPACHELSKKSKGLITLILDNSDLTIDDSEKLTDESVKEISTLENLSCLKLVSCKNLTDRSMKYISKGLVNSLKSLTLKCCRDITDESTKYIVRLTNLTSLELILIKLSVASLAAIGEELPNLRSFILRSYQNSSDIVKIIHVFKNIRELTLDIEPDSKDLIHVIVKELTNLTSLSLRGGIFQYISLKEGDLQFLQKLDISYHIFLKDEAIFEIAKLKNLTSLNMDCCTSVTEKSIEVLIKELPKLNDLNIARCYCIDEKAKPEILEMGKHIKFLKL